MILFYSVVALDFFAARHFDEHAPRGSVHSVKQKLPDISMICTAKYGLELL